MVSVLEMKIKDTKDLCFGESDLKKNLLRSLKTYVIWWFDFKNVTEDLENLRQYMLQFEYDSKLNSFDIKLFDGF